LGVGEPLVADEIPLLGRLAGVDFGVVRVGLATCDPTQTWVTPYDTYQRRSETLDAKYFLSFAENERIVAWIVGLPIHCDGQESRKSEEARSFAQWLGRLTGLPVRMYDERFTTAEARRLLEGSGLSPQKKKQRLDQLAAYLILSHFVESTRKGNAGTEPAGLE
jgi:putative holliday junction resolvase